MAVFRSKHAQIKDTDHAWLKLAKGTDLGYRLPSMPAHLEPSLPEYLDSQTSQPTLTVEGEERYILDRYIRKEQQRRPGDRGSPNLLSRAMARLWSRRGYLGTGRPAPRAGTRVSISLKLRLIVVREAPDLLADLYILVDLSNHFSVTSYGSFTSSRLVYLKLSSSFLTFALIRTTFALSPTLSKNFWLPIP